MNLAEAPQTYEALRNLLVKEQFLDSSPSDFSIYLRERKMADLEEMARSADLFLTARKRRTPDMMSKPKSKRGLLQLASGKRAPVMIDCRACGGKESARELNLPIVKGLVEDESVDMLRDTGCEGVVVRRGLVDIIS